MANIDNELQTIATAVYGSEMRTAIHDAIEKVNNGTVDMADDISALGRSIDGLSDDITGLGNDIDEIEAEIADMGGSGGLIVAQGNIVDANYNVGGTYTLQKGGNTVNFFMQLTINPPQSGDYFVIPIGILNSQHFVPKFTDSYDRIYSVTPCPVSSGGDYPFISLVKNDDVYEFRGYNMTATVLASLPVPNLIVSGSYTTADYGTSQSST